uniref:Uncharacterized protein n=1 Tax=Schistocephalus solidus TaxID=70667 RepID=A0A0X3P9G4_SCHSO
MNRTLAVLALKILILAAFINGESSAPGSNLSVVDNFVDAALNAFLEGADVVSVRPPSVKFMGFKLKELTVIGLPSFYRACPLHLEQSGDGGPGKCRFNLNGCFGATNLSVDLQLSNILWTPYDLRLEIKPFVVNFSLELLPEPPIQLRTAATGLTEGVIQPRQVARMRGCNLAVWEGIELSRVPPLFNGLIRSIVRGITQRARMEAACKKILNDKMFPKFLFPIFGKYKNRKNTMQ